MKFTSMIFSALTATALVSGCALTDCGFEKDCPYRNKPEPAPVVEPTPVVVAAPCQQGCGCQQGCKCQQGCGAACTQKKTYRYRVVETQTVPEVVAEDYYYVVKAGKVTQQQPIFVQQ